MTKQLIEILKDIEYKELKALKETVAEIEKQKKKETEEQRFKEKFHQDNKPKANRKITNKSNKGRELKYKFYESYLRLFNLVFVGVSTKEQLYELIQLIDGDNKNFINTMFEELEEYGLIKSINSTIYGKLYILHTFAIKRIYNNDALRSPDTKEDLLKRRIERNNYLLFLIKELSKQESIEPKFINFTENQIIKGFYDGKDPEVISKLKSSSDFVKSTIKQEDLSFLNDFKNSHIVEYVATYTNTTKQDTFYILQNYLIALKPTNLKFYKDCFLRQRYLTSIKKQLINPNTDARNELRDKYINRKEYDKADKEQKKILWNSYKENSKTERERLVSHLRECLRQENAYMYFKAKKLRNKYAGMEKEGLKVDIEKKAYYLTLYDLESRNCFIRKIEHKDNILIVELDYLDIMGNLDSTELEEQIRTIDSIFECAFQGSVVNTKTYFLNINWHLSTIKNLRFLKKRSYEILNAIGNRYGTNTVNNRFYFEGELKHDEGKAPTIINEYTSPQKVQEDIKRTNPQQSKYKPTEAQQKPRNDLKEDKPTKAIKTPQNENYEEYKDLYNAKKREVQQRKATQQIEIHDFPEDAF